VLPVYSPWITDRELAAIALVLRNGAGSGYLKELESNLAEYVGARHAIGMNSSGTGIYAVLRSLDIGPGDEVILPGIVLPSTVNAVVQTGALPVICDVTGDHPNRVGPLKSGAGELSLPPPAARRLASWDMTISTESAARCLSLRTRALICVHWGGQPCNMAEVTDLTRRYGLSLIEDATHALGASYQDRLVGSFGVAAVFGFFPSDDFLVGEGAAVVSNDDRVVGRIRTILNTESGMRRIGMSGLQAALAVHQLEKHEFFLELRTRFAETYCAALAGLPVRLPCAPPDCRQAWHLFTLLPDWPELGQTREGLIARLADTQIACAVPLSSVSELDLAHSSLRVPLSNTEIHVNTALALPLFPRMGEAEVQAVARTFQQAIRAARSSSLAASTLVTRCSDHDAPGGGPAAPQTKATSLFDI
jgi:dTDP-4-amino-4,6-dideoxygalactose transaminase